MHVYTRIHEALLSCEVRFLFPQSATCNHEAYADVSGCNSSLCKCKQTSTQPLSCLSDSASPLKFCGRRKARRRSKYQKCDVIGAGGGQLLSLSLLFSPFLSFSLSLSLPFSPFLATHNICQAVSSPCMCVGEVE